MENGKLFRTGLHKLRNIFHFVVCESATSINVVPITMARKTIHLPKRNSERERKRGWEGGGKRERGVLLSLTQ